MFGRGRCPTHDASSPRRIAQLEVDTGPEGMTMTSLMDAATLRRLADALDQMAETTVQTGVTLCAYGTDRIEIDGINLALESSHDGDRVRYMVDLSGR